MHLPCAHVPHEHEQLHDAPTSALLAMGMSAPPLLSWVGFSFSQRAIRLKNHRHRIEEIRWMKRQSLNAMQSTHFFRFDACVKMIDHTGGSIYIHMSVMIFDLKQCSIAANCTKMFAEMFTHAPTWTSSKHLSVWQYISAYHSLYHKISFRTRPFWGFERCGKQFGLCLLEGENYSLSNFFVVV